MNFSQAVKGCFTNSGKKQSIQSAAQTELGQNLTKEEIASLSTRFSLDELFVNLHKVNCCKNNVKLNLCNILFSMDMDP